MIQEEVVTYEVAKLAKEKGFPQHITDEAYIVDNYGEDDYNIGDRVPISLVPDYMDDVAAPTQSLLQRWLREVKNIHITIDVANSWKIEHTRCLPLKDHNDEIVMVIRSSELQWGDSFGCFDSFEECLEDALKYSLENLV